MRFGDTRIAKAASEAMTIVSRLHRGVTVATGYNFDWAGVAEG
jgi:hypothetical protein